MRYLVALCALTLFAPGWSGAATYDLAAVVEQHIKPRYVALASATTGLNESAVRYCQAPTDAGLAAIKKDLRGAFLAWQGAQHLRFGPIKYLSREHRYAMWPDKRGTVGKHLRRLREDPAVQLADFDISKKSVAVQGFSAIERLLYADAAPDPLDCRILVSITGNLAVMSEALHDDWFEGDEPFARFVTSPGPKNPLFSEEPAVAGEFLNSLYTELELITMQKLGNPLGSGPEKARGRRAEAWRSGLALPAIRVNLEATQAFYQAAFAPALQQSEPGRVVDKQIAAAFEASLTELDQVHAPLAKTIETADGYAQAKALQNAISSTRRLVTRDLAQTLELPIGFNSLDGD